MSNKIIISQLHDWVRRVRASNSYSYEYLGSLISLTDVGFSKSIKANKLSYERIEIIADKLGLLDEFNSITGNISNIPNNTNISEQSKRPSIEDIIAEKVLSKTLPELLEIKELLHKLLDTLNATTLKQSESIKNNEDTIKETFQQLLSLQNSFVAEKNNRNKNNKSG